MKRVGRAKGLTLVELLLVLAATGLIGAAVASMLVAMSYGTSSSKDMRSLVASNKTVNARMSAAIRGSVMVLAQGNDYLVLWTEDTDENGAPSVQEIQRIAREEPGDELASYVAVNSATDTAHPLTDNFNTITQTLITNNDMERTLWATGVDRWDVLLDDATAQDAVIVSYQLSLITGNMSDTVINTVSLRNALSP